MTNMAEITAGRTVISIAHRLNTLRYTDRICVIHNGEIVEFDNHHNLLQQQGLYAQLWQQQTR
ncbi:hypothetical protein VK86_11270 [Moellerella wisconsensis]|nr:hypothetical protein VK86_11270 [Moellerella wisconsensis]